MRRSIIHVTGVICAFVSLGLLAAGELPLSYMVVPTTTNNARNSESAILELTNGRILLAWTEWYTSDARDNGPARISAMTSFDGGRRWKDKYVLQSNIGKLNVMEPNLLRLHSGKILFIFARKDSVSDCYPMERISTDDAQTFSSPKSIPVVPYPSYTAFNNDRVIQLRSGRILLPAYYFMDIRHVHPIHSLVYFSDDEGQSWKPSQTIANVKESNVGVDEPGVVELKDGRIMLWARTSAGHPYQCYSTEGGKSWTTPEPMSVVSPNSPQSIKRIPSTGDLLMVWNNSPTERFPLTTAISSDDGHTWQHVRNLDDDAAHTYAYASITFEGDHVIFTYYAGPPVGADDSGHWSLKLKSLPVRSLYE